MTEHEEFLMWFNHQHEWAELHLYNEEHCCKTKGTLADYVARLRENEEG